MSDAAYKAGYDRIEWKPAPPLDPVYHEPPKRAHGLATPGVVRSFAQPVKSMADGKYYDTPRDLERTYRADGNPQGKEYACVGDDPLPEFKKPTRDRKAQREAIVRAIETVEAGNAPPVMTTNQMPL